MGLFKRKEPPQSASATSLGATERQLELKIKALDEADAADQKVCAGAHESSPRALKLRRRGESRTKQRNHLIQVLGLTRRLALVPAARDTAAAALKAALEQRTEVEARLSGLRLDLASRRAVAQQLSNELRDASEDVHRDIAMAKASLDAAIEASDEAAVVSAVDAVAAAQARQPQANQGLEVKRAVLLAREQAINKLAEQEKVAEGLLVDAEATIKACTAEVFALEFDAANMACIAAAVDYAAVAYDRIEYDDIAYVARKSATLDNLLSAKAALCDKVSKYEIQQRAVFAIEYRRMLEGDERLGVDLAALSGDPERDTPASPSVVVGV